MLCGEIGIFPQKQLQRATPLWGAGPSRQWWRLWGRRKIVHCCKITNYRDLYARIALYVWLRLTHAIPGDYVVCTVQLVIVQFHICTFSRNVQLCALCSHMAPRKGILTRCQHILLKIWSNLATQLYLLNSWIVFPHWRSQLTIRASMGSCNMKNNDYIHICMWLWKLTSGIKKTFLFFEVC